MDRYTLVSPDGRSKRSVEVGQQTILGKGGEAVIHRDSGEPKSGALKIYHAPSAKRERKIEAFLGKNGKFPDTVAAPRAMLLDDSGHFAGFGMAQLSSGFVRFKELFDPTFCADNDITTKVVADLGLAIATDLTEIHKTNSIVGDLNDGAIMFHKGDHKVGWVDVDSWSIPKYPCIVGTQLYLCPELFGVDLSKGDHFESWHDWYSWAVLIFRALLRKHPFKAGIHHDHNGIIERAQHGLTVLDKSVAYPPVGLKADMLSDDLADALIKHLKRQTKGPFNLDILREYRQSLAPCPSCGIWYPTSRKLCPNCSKKTVVELPKLLGVDVLEFIKANGRIVHVALVKNVVLCIAEEAGDLVLYRRESVSQSLQGPVQKKTLGLNFQSGMRFGVFKDTLVVCVEGDEFSETGDLFLFDLERFQPVTRTTTGKLAGTGNGPVFATSRRFLYRLAKNMIIREDRFLQQELLPRPIAQISEGQSWFTADSNPVGDAESLLGFSRDIDEVKWFLLRGDKDGRVYTRFDLAVTQLESRESLIDFSIRFGGDKNGAQVLLMRRTRKRGKEFVRLEKIESETGAVLSSEIFDIDAQPQWESVYGKALFGNILLHSTANGIMRENLETHQVVPVNGTESLSTTDDRLIPYGKGVLVVRPGEVSFVTPR